MKQTVTIPKSLITRFGVDLGYLINNIYQHEFGVGNTAYLIFEKEYFDTLVNSLIFQDFHVSLCNVHTHNELRFNALNKLFSLHILRMQVVKGLKVSEWEWFLIVHMDVIADFMQLQKPTSEIIRAATKLYGEVDFTGIDFQLYQEIKKDSLL